MPACAFCGHRILYFAAIGSMMPTTTWALLRPSAYTAPCNRVLLRPTPAYTAPCSRVQRTRRLLAQHGGWTTAVDQTSGQTYYYNEQTGESQWEPPQAAANHAWSHPHGSKTVLWRMVGSSGTRSRYNLRKHDVRVLSRYDMLKRSLFVSRKQCLVSCLADGTAKLTSVGKPPTLWRERSGPWCLVGRGESLFLTDGDQVSLDVNNPDGTTFTCEEKSARQQGGFQQNLG